MKKRALIIPLWAVRVLSGGTAVRISPRAAQMQEKFLEKGLRQIRIFCKKLTKNIDFYVNMC